MDNIPSYLMLLLIAVFFSWWVNTANHSDTQSVVYVDWFAFRRQHTCVVFFLFLGGAYWDVVDVFKQTTTCYVR